MIFKMNVDAHQDKKGKKKHTHNPIQSVESLLPEKLLSIFLFQFLLIVLLLSLSLRAFASPLHELKDLLVILSTAPLLPPTAFNLAPLLESILAKWPRLLTCNKTKPVPIYRVLLCFHI